MTPRLAVGTKPELINKLPQLIAVVLLIFSRLSVVLHEAPTGIGLLRSVVGKSSRCNLANSLMFLIYPGPNFVVRRTEPDVIQCICKNDRAKTTWGIEFFYGINC